MDFKKKLKIGILTTVLLFLANCSNSGSNRMGPACRNQCLAEQSLCYLVTTNMSVPKTTEYSVTCQLFFVGCLSDCQSGTRNVSRSSSRSSGSSSRSGGGSSGGGSSGGGSSGGGSSGSGHGGSGH